MGSDEVPTVRVPPSASDANSEVLVTVLPRLSAEARERQASEHIKKERP